MKAMIFAVFALVVCTLSGVVGSNIPGKVAIWSSAEKTAESAVLSHITKSAAPADVIHALRTAAAGNKNIVVLTSNKDSAEKSSVLIADAVAMSVKSSQAAQVFSNVYHSRDSAVKTLSENLHSAQIVQDIQQHSLQEAVERMEAASSQAAHAMTVTVDSADAAHQALLHRLFAAARKHSGAAHSTLFVAVDEPSADAVAPVEKGEYTRLLTETPSKQRKTAQTADTTAASVASAPIAGAEFSIYYEGTYLYITPDLFTGIMTALFMVFVVLTGFSCMGSIQGMSTFYDRVPTNGREA